MTYCQNFNLAYFLLQVSDERLQSCLHLQVKFNILVVKVVDKGLLLNTDVEELCFLHDWFTVYKAIAIMSSNLLQVMDLRTSLD